jgi:hypothetical protein
MRKTSPGKVGRPFRLDYSSEELARLTVDVPPNIKHAIVESAESHQRLLSDEVQLALEAWVQPADNCVPTA